MNRGPKHSFGSAMIILLVMLGLAALFFVGTFVANPQIQRDKMTQDALIQAKEALIGYAAAYPETAGALYVPGHLPCPDQGTGTEGLLATPSCGSKDVSAIGRLPWRTLGLPPLRDSSGECLWYAVSGSFKTSIKPDLLNWDSIGQFEILDSDGVTKIAGSTVDNRAVAVIFAPGKALGSQSRAAAGTAAECGGNYTASNYLDTAGSINNSVVSAVAQAVTQFIVGPASSSFNDRLVYITADEIFAKRIQRRADFPGKYFSDNVNLTTAILNDFALNPVTGLIDNLNPGNTNIGGVSTNPLVFGLLQKTAECLVRYGKNNSTTADKRLPWASPLNIADFSYDTLDDSVNLRAGRVPFRVNDSAGAIPANLLVTSSNSYRLLTITRCTAGWVNVAGAGGTTSQHGWWDKWKDHLFYAVADAFKPTSTLATQTYPCDTGTCLWVDGIGPYAAIVMFAGPKLASPAQSRSTLAQKIVVGNYLEGINATSVAAGSGVAYTRVTSATANDTLICINQNLTIDPTCASPVAGTAPPPTTDLGGTILDILGLSSPPPGGDTGQSSYTLPDGTVISAAGGGTSTITVTNQGVGVDAGTGSPAITVSEYLDFTYPSTRNKMTFYVNKLGTNDSVTLYFYNGSTLLGSTIVNGCSNSASIFSNISLTGSPDFTKIRIAPNTSSGMYLLGIQACAGTGSCSISDAGATTCAWP